MSALLLSITFQSAVSPLALPPLADGADAPADYAAKASALEVANVLGVVSMMLSLTIIVLTTTFLMEVGFGRGAGASARSPQTGILLPQINIPS